MLSGFVFASAYAETKLAGRFMGTGTCSSSNCHGSSNPRTGTSVMQNEYFTWEKHDRHSKAYRVLESADGRRMASLLGMKSPTEEPLCLKCHATYVPDSALRGDKFQIEDGVSCEACHGAAGGWVESHATKGVTHADNVGNGLRDLAPMDKRATMCVSCHFGTDDKTVNHKLYGAGHPRLTFEMDTFSILQPKHWDVDDDYVNRKGDYVPARSWLIGQLVHGRETIKALTSPIRSKNGMFPELSLFDCYSCHHPLGDDQWKQRTYGGKPGELKVNLPSLVTLARVVPVLDAAAGKALQENLASVHTGYAMDGSPAALSRLSTVLETKVLPAIYKTVFDDAVLTKLIRANLDAISGVSNPTYELAEQVTMGVQALCATSPSIGAKYKSELEGLYRTLKTEESFEPGPFVQAVGVLGARVR